MGSFHITGGIPLFGEVKIGGCKNAVLPMLAAAILGGGVSVIRGCPVISDTMASLEILRRLGCEARIDGDVITIDSSGLNSFEMPRDLVAEMRSSIIFMGGLLGRCGRARISAPGGCNIGERPIDLHLNGLRKLGAVIDENEDSGIMDCSADRLTGARINLTYPSVGATQNIMLAATLADGETIITNAAKEPEIEDLQGMLNASGAQIKGAGTHRIVIKGVGRLHDVDYTIMPDRIIAGTYLSAAAITRGSVLLTNVNHSHIAPIVSPLIKMGAKVTTEPGAISLAAPSGLSAIDFLSTQPHPGFPTDMQAQFTALLTQCNGTSILAETVFESRCGHVPPIIQMGADITTSLNNSTFVIRGVTPLHGIEAAATDLRSGAALILAGLAANGNSQITNTSHILRGYEDIAGDLRQLGADVRYE